MAHEEHIGYLIKRISDALSARANLGVRAIDLTFSQSRVLGCLMKRGALTQRELELEFGVAHPTMVGILRRLADKGFVTSSVSASDRRQRDVCLTNKGREIAMQMRDGMLSNERALTEGMSGEELHELNRLLRKIYDNLKQEGV